MRIGAGFVLLSAALIFFDSGALVPALAPVVAVHELGHALAMLLLGARPSRLTATATGLWLDYRGELNGTGEALCALAGPALGLAAAFFCSKLGKSLGSDNLLLCAGVGGIVNFFNLLPCLPLDGGRALAGLGIGDRAVFCISLATSIMLTIFGFILAVNGRGVALCLCGGWLLLFLLKRHL